MTPPPSQSTPPTSPPPQPQRRSRGSRATAALTAGFLVAPAAALAGVIAPPETTPLPLAQAATEAPGSADGALSIAPGESLQFDFGCADSPVSGGHQGVHPGLDYSAERGYGLHGTVDCRDRPDQDDDALRDFTVGWDYQFQVDLADGDYFVTLVSGDEDAANNSSATVNGNDLGSFSPRDPGTFGRHGVDVTIDGEPLTVAMRDDGRLNAVIISQVTPPTGLTSGGIDLDEPSATLSWEAMEGAALYTVYRSPVGQDAFESIGTADEPTFIDTSVETGFSYDYAVTQSNTAGAESARSEPTTISVTDAQVSAPDQPSAPEVVSANASGTTVGWEPVEGAERYQVYRSLNREGDYQRVAETAETEFTADGESEHSWFYAIRAVNTGGNSENSAATVTPRTMAPVESGRVDPRCGATPGDAEVTQDGAIWTTVGPSGQVYQDYSMVEAIQAGVDSLDPARTSQQRVVVRGSGTMPATAGVELTDHTSLEVCGTLNVAGDESPFSYEQHIGAVSIRYAEDISVPFLNVTGDPNFAVYLRTSSNVHFGQIDLRLSSGHGMRMDSRDDDSVRNARNISIDDVYVSGTETHGVETYGVDGFTVGTVRAVNVGHAGVLLNNTVNADIASIHGTNVAAGTGYATFRTANRNGMLDGEYPTTIRVGEVIADGGGRGIFCVSESGGLEIERVQISGTQNNAMLLENCHNLNIASEGGTVEGPGDIVISARTEFDNNSDLVLQNLTLIDTAINELVCGERTVLHDLTLENSEVDACVELTSSEEDTTDDSTSPPPTQEGDASPVETAAPDAGDDHATDSPRQSEGPEVSSPAESALESGDTAATPAEGHETPAATEEVTGSGLAHTGQSPAPLIWSALVLIGLGLCATLVTRRAHQRKA